MLATHVGLKSTSAHRQAGSCRCVVAMQLSTRKLQKGKNEPEKKFEALNLSMTYILPGLSVDWIFWEAQTKMIASDFAAIPYVSSVLAS